MVRLGVPLVLATGLMISCAAAPEPSGDFAATTVSTTAATEVVTNRESLGSGRLRAYGDSVMLGAKAKLRKRLNARVKARESWQSSTVLSKVRKDFKRGRIGGPVVIHTGTNGTVVRRELNRTVKKVQRKHRVVLINVKAPRSWTASNNRIIKKIAKKYRHAVLLNWNQKAKRHPGWTYSDGIHLTPRGQTAYVKAIARKDGR